MTIDRTMAREAEIKLLLTLDGAKPVRLYDGVAAFVPNDQWTGAVADALAHPATVRAVCVGRPINVRRMQRRAVRLLLNHIMAEQLEAKAAELRAK